jgi:hypothetical protein
MCISERQRILLKSISNSLSIYIYMDKLNYIYIYDKLYTYMINYVIFFFGCCGNQTPGLIHCREVLYHQTTSLAHHNSIILFFFFGSTGF